MDEFKFNQIESRTNELVAKVNEITVKINTYMGFFMKHEDAISKLQEQMSSAESSASVENILNEQGKRIVKNAERTQGIEKTIEELAQREQNMESMLNALSERQTGTGNGVDLSSIEQKLNELEEKLSSLPASNVTDGSSVVLINRVNEQEDAIDAIRQNSARLESILNEIIKRTGEGGVGTANVDLSSVESKILDQNRVINQLTQKSNNSDALIRTLIEKNKQYDQLITSGAEGGLMLGGGTQDKLISDLSAKDRKHDELISELSEKINMHFKLINDFKSENDSYRHDIDDCKQQLASLRTQFTNSKVITPQFGRRDKKEGGISAGVIFAIIALILSIITFIRTDPNLSSPSYDSNNETEVSTVATVTTVASDALAE